MTKIAKFAIAIRGRSNTTTAKSRRVRRKGAQWKNSSLNKMTIGIYTEQYDEVFFKWEHVKKIHLNNFLNIDRRPIDQIYNNID